MSVTAPVAKPIPYSPGKLSDSEIFIAETVANAEAPTFVRLFPIRMVINN